MTLRQQLHAWSAERNEAPDARVYACDADHAARVGLPVLAALSAMCDRLQAGGDYISRAEIVAELRPILSVAVGEAAVRIQAQGVHGATAPGLPTIPRRVLEQDT